MANVEEYVEQIANAIYGEEVRESICGAITAMNTESSSAFSVAVSSQTSAKAYAESAESSAETAEEAKERVEKIVQDLGNPIVPKGTISFANLPSVSDTSIKVGFMYNINDDFTTTSDFREGAGKDYGAGTNVYLDSDRKWDCYASSTVAVDTEMSTTSNNAIANSTVTNAYLTKVDSENGVHGLRVNNEELQFKESSTDTWKTISGGGKFVTKTAEEYAQMSEAEKKSGQPYRVTGVETSSISLASAIEKADNALTKATTNSAKIGSGTLDVGADLIDGVNSLNQNLSELIKANGTGGINITSSVTGSGYTCPSNGFVFANICPYVSAVAIVKRNGRNVLLLRNSMSGSGYIQQQNEFIAHKNDVITYSQDGVCESPSFWFYADV